MKKSNAPLIMSILLLLVSATLLPTVTVKGDWSTFRHDQSHSGSSTSVAPTTNRTLWTYTTGGQVLSSPAVSGGIVFVGSNDGKVYALNATTGTQIWNYTTGNYVYSSPAVSDGAVYVGSNDGKVYALNATTGGKIWNYTTSGSVQSSPAVSGGIVFIGSFDGKVYALNATTGTQIWNYTTGIPGRVNSSPAVSGGVVYVGSYDNNVYALNATTGGKIWNYTTASWVFSSAAVSGGVVYVGSYDNNVYALNATTGGKIWNYTTDASIIMSSPAVSGGVVFIGSYDGKVYALNATTGTQIWNYATGNYVYSSPAVSDGAVYVGSSNGKVYAFGYTVSISFRTSGMGADAGSSPVLTIDLTPYNYTQLQSLSFNWVAGSTHTVTASDPVSGGSGKQYVFSSWTNGDGLSGSNGTYTTPSLGVYGSATVTVNYKTQYWLVFQQSGVGVDFSGTVVIVNGTDYDRFGTSFWADSGGMYSFAYSSPLVVVANGKQYVFLSANVTSPLTVSGPETVIGSYRTRYYLTVVSPFDTPGGMGWYNENDTAYATLAYRVENITSKVRAVFNDWTGDASGSSLTSDPITMNGPKTAVADWEIQYFLDVVTDPSTLPPIPGADWYDNCTWVSLTAPQYVPSEAGLNGVRYSFTFWYVDGTSQGTGVNPIDVHMDAPHIATAHFALQYYLTIQTNPPGVDSPTGEGWYDVAAIAPISTDQYFDIVPGSSRYKFTGWATTDMTEITDPSATSTTVFMDKAKTVTANYVTQYNITFDQSGVGSDFTGTVVVVDGSNYDTSGLPVSFWYDSGSTHSFAYQSPLVVGSGAKQYDWTSTDGLSTLQSELITITNPGNITGNYVTHVHDVAVTSVVADRAWVYQGFSANINVTVKNNGDFSETVAVTLYYNITENKIIGIQNATLLTGESKTLQFTWNTTSVPYCHNYTLTAVATIPADYNAADNTLDNTYIKVRILGDVNGDGKVDGKDIALAAISFGTVPEDARWNPDADINLDGKIDGKDLVLIALRFGMACSP